MQKTGKPLSELAGIMESFPQILKNVRLSQKIAIENIPGLLDAQQAFSTKPGNNGRILIRPSGTEPVIRVMAEGSDQAEIEAIVDELCAIIEKLD
jgi:phosphoglucosamine mutase